MATTFARTHKVQYNANGGSGAPSAVTQTRTITPSSYPATLSVGVSVSSGTPTRSGYTFLGWSITSGSSAQYSAGDTIYHTWSIASDDPLTGTFTTPLYAVWRAQTYTVTYNANGGSGAPAKQTKTHGTALKLSSAVPTRAGWTFAGWNTTQGGTGTAYAAGASYTANASVTLYAQWTRITYKVTYDAGAGTGAPAAQTKTYGTSLTLSSTKPTRDGYAFTAWNTASDGSGTTYAPGGTYTANAAVTLYAQWYRMADADVESANHLITTSRTVHLFKTSAGDRVAVTAQVGTSATLSLYDGTGSSFTWNTSGYGQYLPAATSGLATLTITTYLNGTAVGSRTKNYALEIPSYTPAATVSIVDSDNTLKTRFGVLVKDKSKAKVTVTASSSYGATISRIVTALEGTTYTGASFTSAILTTAGDKSVKTRVDDSRGKSVSVYTDLRVDDWFTPGATLKLSRAVDSATVKLTYTVAPVSGGGHPNDKTYSIEYRRTTDQSYTTLDSGTLPDFSGTLTRTLSSLEAGSAYSVRVTVEDYFTSTEVVKILPAADTVILRGQVSDHSLHFPRHTVVEASYEIAEGAWKKYTELSSVDDLNDLLAPGSYKATSNSIAAAVGHSPTGYAFTMTVENSRGEEVGSPRAVRSAVQRMQTVRDYFGNTYRRRLVIPSSGTIDYYPWKQDEYANGTTAATLFAEAPTLTAIEGYSGRATFSGGYAQFGKLVIVSTTLTVASALAVGSSVVATGLPHTAEVVGLSACITGAKRTSAPLAATVSVGGNLSLDRAGALAVNDVVYISGVYFTT